VGGRYRSIQKALKEEMSLIHMRISIRQKRIYVISPKFKLKKALKKNGTGLRGFIIHKLKEKHVLRGIKQ
jgi:hypothetical protein